MTHLFLTFDIYEIENKEKYQTAREILDGKSLGNGKIKCSKIINIKFLIWNKHFLMLKNVDICRNHVNFGMHVT